MNDMTCKMPAHGLEDASAACCRPSSPSYMGPAALPALPQTFWTDRDTWVSAARNTLNCLIGCFIGDFGAIIFIQAFYPGMAPMLMMAIAMVTGLITSVLFEATILRYKEGFGWQGALRMAVSMSFISMLGMEAAANATDYLLTNGGNVSLSEPWYWGALAISLVVGFLAPLPYNYYKLRKHGKACH